MSRRKHLEETAQITASWVEPDTSTLSQERRSRYEVNCKALCAYIEGVKLDIIEEQYGVKRQQLVRLLDRALKVDRAGKAYGFRSCIPNFRIKAAVRKTALRSENTLRGKGFACAMQGVIASHPKLQSFIDEQLPIAGRRLGHRRLSRLFYKFKSLVSECVPPDEYPLNLPDNGRQVFRRYLKRQSKLHARDCLAGISEHVPPRIRSGTGTGTPSLSLSKDIYEEVELDGWLQPADIEILLPSFSDDYAPQRITGIGLLVLVDRKSRCVIGKYPLFSTSYDLTEFLLCINGALEPWTPRVLEIPFFQYPPGSGLPSGLHPGAKGRMWDILFIDNARVHVSEKAKHALIDKVFCHVNFGRAGEPTARPIVERFFEHLNQLWIKKLLPKRIGKPGKAKISIKPDYAVPMAWIEDLFDVLVCEYNVTPHSALQNQTPLSVMLHALDREKGWGRSDPSENAAWRKITHIEVERPLHLPKGRHPYVNYESGVYSSEMLRFADFSMERDPHVVLDVNLLDLQYVGAKLKGGPDLGILYVRPPWSGEPHDLSLRRLIAKSMRREGVPLSDSDHIVRDFREALKLRAKTSRQAASQLARMEQRGQGSSSAHSKSESVRRSARRGWISVDDA